MDEFVNMESQSIQFSSAIEDMCEINSSFDHGVMRIAYHGANRNGSYIDKETFERALPSIKNCPIVCNYNRETDSIGGHDIEIVQRNNATQLINVTAPVGIVPESAMMWWDEVKEPDGQTHEYLFTDILLWKRQEAYQHIKDNGITDESMEIGVRDGYRADDGYYHVKSFEFRAFCLLENTTPCFESAAIELFSLAGFKEQYSKMIEDIKREYEKWEQHEVMTASADDIQKFSSKGGTNDLDVTELMQKYGLTAEDVDFDTDNMSQEEIENRFAEIKEREQNKPEESSSDEEGALENEEQADDDETIKSDEPDSEEDPDSEKFSLTAEQLSREMCEELYKVTYFDPCWGETRRYCYMDHDCVACEIYAYDVSDDHIYGFPFKLNGDHVVIDFVGKKRKKTVFADFDEGDPSFSIRNIIGDFRNKIEQREADENEVFSKFSDLAGNEMFETLRENCSTLSIEQIEEKCFAIRGRNITANFSLENAGMIPRIPIEREDAFKLDEPYGGVFAKYNVGKR